jgi:hypothetical protein
MDEPSKFAIHEAARDGKSMKKSPAHSTSHDLANEASEQQPLSNLSWVSVFQKFAFVHYPYFLSHELMLIFPTGQFQTCRPQR